MTRELDQLRCSGGRMRFRRGARAVGGEMNSSILTFSQTGNTLKVARAIGVALESNGVQVEHVSFLRRRRWNPSAAELIGVGCPVFENRPVELVLDFIKSRELGLAGKKAFVFVTSGGSPARSLWRLGEAVRQAGAKVVGGIQIRGNVVYPTLADLFPGRPNEDDLARATAFGQALAGCVLRGEPLGPEHLLDLRRGRGLYDFLGPRMSRLKRLARLPASDPAKCDLCGACVQECPSGSIHIKDNKIEFADACIRCYWCWQVCPPMAISVEVSPGNGAIERNLYSERLERRIGDIQPDERVGPNRYREMLARQIRVRFDPENRSSEILPAEVYSRRRRTEGE
jgi:ferredoxin